MRGGEGRAKGGAKTGETPPLPQPQGGSAPSGMGGIPKNGGIHPKTVVIRTHTHPPPPTRSLQARREGVNPGCWWGGA